MQAVPTIRHVVAGQIRCDTAWLSLACARHPSQWVAGDQMPRPQVSQWDAAMMPARWCLSVLAALQKTAADRSGNMQS